jgi:hypothetical protein
MRSILARRLDDAAVVGTPDLLSLRQELSDVSTTLLRPSEVLDSLAELLFFSPHAATSAAIAHHFRPLLLDLSARVLLPAAAAVHGGGSVGGGAGGGVSSSSSSNNNNSSSSSSNRGRKRRRTVRSGRLTDDEAEQVWAAVARLLPSAPGILPLVNHFILRSPSPFDALANNTGGSVGPNRSRSRGSAAERPAAAPAAGATAGKKNNKSDLAEEEKQPHDQSSTNNQSQVVHGDDSRRRRLAQLSACVATTERLVAGGGGNGVLDGHGVAAAASLWNWGALWRAVDSSLAAMRPPPPPAAPAAPASAPAPAGSSDNDNDADADGDASRFPTSKERQLLAVVAVSTSRIFQRIFGVGDGATTALRSGLLGTIATAASAAAAAAAAAAEAAKDVESPSGGASSNRLVRWRAEWDHRSKVSAEAAAATAALLAAPAPAAPDDQESERRVATGSSSSDDNEKILGDRDDERAAQKKNKNKSPLSNASSGNGDDRGDDCAALLRLPLHPAVANVCGVLLLRRLSTLRQHQPTLATATGGSLSSSSGSSGGGGGYGRLGPAVLVPSARRNLRNLARLVQCDGAGAAAAAAPAPWSSSSSASSSTASPVLLCGPPGSGKTSLLRALAAAVGRADDNTDGDGDGAGDGSLLELHLDESVDAKALLGTYVCGSRPGEFLWAPGPLASAMVSDR